MLQKFRKTDLFVRIVIYYIIYSAYDCEITRCLHVRNLSEVFHYCLVELGNRLLVIFLYRHQQCSDLYAPVI